MRELGTIQEKILDRALYLIGKKGSYDVPIRDITREAGVNVNAINYYFGNKDSMIEQMEKFFIRNYLSAYAVLDETMDDEKKLILWANEIMEYTLQYPGIQMILRDNLKSERSGGMKQFLEEKASFYDRKVDRLLKSILGVDDERLYLVRVLFNSAVLYPASFGTDFSFSLSRIHDKNFRLRYLTFMITMLKKGMSGYEI